MVLVRDPRAAHQFGLADIQRRYPLDDLLAVLALGEHLASSHCRAAAARRSHGHSWRNLILVLEATMNGP
jgi:hypothetical protein